ncbi:uncharacterized protein LOC130677444 [Microplitis mediator]|uniref:uncharacterized protein LOC130677444 n=1 Tax=Microplitis mediator TaxID=375433 RepID=UPI0025570577|nr:uncharacterized protein LOC130677444 [Microplitis mediator]
MYYKDEMYLFSILVICSSILMLEAFDLHSLDYIDEIISFVTESSSDETAGQQLDQLKIDNEKNYAKIINKYFTEAPHLEVTNEEYEKLEGLIEKIDKAWEQFGTKDLTDDDKNELSDLPETLSQLYKIYVGDGADKNLPTRIADDKRPSMCEIESNEQLRLRKLHQSVILSELRGFILSLKSSEDVEKTTARAILHSEEYILATQSGFEETVDLFRRCDPPEHIRGKTFSEFLGLFQGVVVNDQHTNAGNGRCSTSCGGLDFSRIDRCYIMYDRYGNGMKHCHAKRCNGILYDCFSTGNTHICELDENSDRRFQWAKRHDNNQVFGEPGDCEGKRYLIKEGLKSLDYCYTCMCTCAEQDGSSTAIRTISLIPQYADIENNMVVTGVRFVNKYQLFHIQIEQSKLGPYGEIVPGTSKWKKLPRFSYDEKDNGGFRMDTKMGQRKLFNNIDFKFITYDSRTINIDQLKTPKGEIIVGVTFVYNKETKAVELQILPWPFDYKTGKLEDPIDLEDEDADFESDWINWQTTPRRSSEYDRKRRYLDLFKLDDPIKAPTNPPYSDPNEALKIRATGFRLDMAQHTIPYIDLQPVALSDLKVPLSGLELFYRRQKGYGGFLGFKIRGYDFYDFFGTEMSQDDLDKYKNNFDEDIVLDIPTKSN